MDTAFRVSKHYRGKGIGQAFTQWRNGYLEKYQPQVNTNLLNKKIDDTFFMQKGKINAIMHLGWMADRRPNAQPKNG